MLLFWSKTFDSKHLALVKFLCFWKSLLMPGSTAQDFSIFCRNCQNTNSVQSSQSSSKKMKMIPLPAIPFHLLTDSTISDHNFAALVGIVSGTATDQQYYETKRCCG